MHCFSGTGIDGLKLCFQSFNLRILLDYPVG